MVSPKMAFLAAVVFDFLSKYVHLDQSMEKEKKNFEKLSVQVLIR